MMISELTEEKIAIQPVAESKKYKMIFLCYGTLRLNQGNWRWCLNGVSDYLGTMQTEPDYTMYSFGGFPAVAEGGDTAITIDVFGTDDLGCIIDVRGLEGYRGPDDPKNYYDVIKLTTPYGTGEMFIMNEAHQRNLVKVVSGDWIQFKKERGY